MADQDLRQYGSGWGGDDGTPDNNTLGLAATVATAADPVATEDTASSDPAAGSALQAQPGVNEIVFIDGAVPDAQLLAAGVKAGVQAVILDPSQDGVVQIAAYLASHNAQGLAAIAIVSHGADGELFLGSSVLDASTIGQYQPQLAQLGAALKPGGGLLLYGCDVAQDAAGVAFVDQLSAATGGSNIAAASHLVGAPDQGGSFTLDVNTGQIVAPTPFTDQVQASFAGVLPTAVNQLYFTVSNTVPSASVNRVNQIGVSGTTTIGTAVDLIDGSQATFAAGTTAMTFPGVAVDPAAGKFFFTDTNSNATLDKIWQGNIANPGTVTQILSTPTTTTQVQGLAIDEPNGNLYYALNASTAGSIGIYEVSESGGTPVEVVGGFTSTAHALFQIALDVPDNLVFFADSPGLTSVSTLWAGNLLSHTATALATSTKGSRLEGVAFNNGTVYWSTINGGTVANNNIFSAAVTVTGSGSLATASLGTTSTLYAGAATGNGTIANTPISLAVDPVSGVLYSGSNIVTGGTYFAIINAGTVTGGSSMTTIFSSSFAGTASAAAPIVALTLESTPTVAASGSVNYIIGGSAVTVDSTASVSNPSGFNLASATVAITGGTFTNDGDTLTATTAGTSITMAFSGETLTLSGDDTLAHYKQVLDSVTFKSTAADPGNGGANLTRTVSWTVSDGIITSTTPTTTINVHGAPTITAGGTVSFTGGGSATTLDPGITISDPYSTTISTAAISIGGFINGDLLNFTNQNGITGSYASATGTLTLSGTASVANYQTALGSVQYDFTPSNGDPTGGGSQTSRTISWVVNDGVVASAAANSFIAENAAPCYLAGTLISTDRGELPVERLAVGDMVLTLRGEARPITWIGQGRVLATRGRRNAATPVIVRKNALADNVPKRNLRVTKGHALFIDKTLIPVEELINHRSILWDDTTQEVGVYHIELATHDVLIANGAPAESYRDDGNRWLFHNANIGWGVPPQAPCAPLQTNGKLVDAVWQRLLDRCGPRPGLPMTDEPDLHLLADGRRIDASSCRDAVYRYRLGGRPSTLRVVSRAAVPMEMGVARDPRCLGVAVRRIELVQGRRLTLIEADDPLLTESFHAFEPDNGFCWTDGDATLPDALFDGFTGPFELSLHIGATSRYLDKGQVLRAA